MSGVELGLAIFGTLDLCLGYVVGSQHSWSSLIFFRIRYGKTIVDKYKAFNNAEHEIKERTLAIEATWSKISQQLDFLKRVWQSLGEDYQDLQPRIIQVLEKKLQAAVLQVSKLEKNSTRDGSSSKRKAGKYSFGMKHALEKAILDLQTWQKEFDTTWFLILRVADRIIDTELVKRPGTEKLSVARHVRDALQREPQRKISVFLPESNLSSAKRSDIPYSTSQLIEIAGSGTFLLDSADCSSGKNGSVFAKHVRHLAARLRQVDANTFHLLRCHGVVRTIDLSTKQALSYDFIFNIPKGCYQPQSLRSHLLSQVEYPLSEKMSLAKQLARSINYIHILDIVHKNIRPETILIFQRGGRSSQLGPLFLLGFKAFRMADSKTLRVGTSIWEEYIYQHPDRQGTNPRAEYVMQHDIYSLGVCLLEIGLWVSFVGSNSHKNPLIEKNLVKEQFTALAREKLPIRMGEKYTQVVINCLSCLDLTNEDFGNQCDFEDDDGILIGLKYIEKV